MESSPSQIFPQLSLNVEIGPARSSEFETALKLVTLAGPTPDARAFTASAATELPATADIDPCTETEFSVADEPQGSSVWRDLLQASNRGEISLEGLIVARVGGQVQGAVLGIVEPDGVAHGWPAVIMDIPQASLVADALMQALRRWLVNSGTTFAQVLTRLEDTAAHDCLQRNGFEHLTDLVCWMHDLVDIPHAPLPDECEPLDYVVELTPRFEAVMAATYVESQDCLGMQGRRTAAQCLTGHSHAVDAEHRIWRVFRQLDEDVGVVLCADHRDQQMWELLYLGVVPKFRRNGYGLSLLCQALLDARDAGALGMYLAADDANGAAANLYEAAGFQPAFRQRIHVWIPD